VASDGVECIAKMDDGGNDPGQGNALGHELVDPEDGQRYALGRVDNGECRDGQAKDGHDGSAETKGRPRPIELYCGKTGQDKAVNGGDNGAGYRWNHYEGCVE